MFGRISFVKTDRDRKLVTILLMVLSVFSVFVANYQTKLINSRKEVYFKLNIRINEARDKAMDFAVEYKESQARNLIMAREIEEIKNALHECESPSK